MGAPVVGDAVGASEGAADGVADGESVGTLVGAGVGHVLQLTGQVLATTLHPKSATSTAHPALSFEVRAQYVVGVSVGCAEGAWVGVAEGAADGA